MRSLYKYILTGLVFALAGFFVLVGTASAQQGTFTRNLQEGSIGEEVTRLQELLAADSTLYPEGIVSGYYGSLTTKAVQRFQARHQIVSSGSPFTTGYGLVGPKTREVLNTETGSVNVPGNHSPTTPTTKGPASAVVGESVVYVFSSTDPDGDALTYRIKWGNKEETVSSPLKSSYSLSYAWPSAGSFSLTVIAQDGKGASSQSTLQVSVGESSVATRPDYLVQSIKVIPSAPAVGEELTLRLEYANVGAVSGLRPDIALVYSGAKLLRNGINTCLYNTTVAPGAVCTSEWHLSYSSVGEKAISVEIDKSERIEETREGNNAKTLKFLVSNSSSAVSSSSSNNGNFFSSVFGQLADLLGLR